MSDLKIKNGEIDLKVDWTKMQNLVPVVVQDASSLRVLMLGYMNPESFQKTLSTQRVHFYSRSRQALWLKGETSGHFLNVVSITSDCDQDSLLIKVRPEGPTCHTGAISCFGDEIDAKDSLGFLAQLENVIADRLAHASKNEALSPTSPSKTKKPSYIASLKAEGLTRMAQKVGEEAVETVIAALSPKNETELQNEAADLLFHLMVLLQEKNLSLGHVAQVLAARHSPSN